MHALPQGLVPKPLGYVQGLLVIICGTYILTNKLPHKCMSSFGLSLFISFFFILTFRGMRVGKAGSKCKDFKEYVHKCLNKLGLKDRISEVCMILSYYQLAFVLITVHKGKNSIIFIIYMFPSCKYM